MVNRLGELSRVFTPAAAVTFCSVITPETGAKISTMRARMVRRRRPARAGAPCAFSTVDLRLGVGILRDLQILLRDGAFVVRSLARSSCACASVSSATACGNRKSACEISALCTRISSWPLVTVSPSARANLHHAAGGQRNHRNVARHVRAHRAGDIQLRRGVVLRRPSPAGTAPDDPP